MKYISSSIPVVVALNPHLKCAQKHRSDIHIFERSQFLAILSSQLSTTQKIENLKKYLSNYLFYEYNSQKHPKTHPTPNIFETPQTYPISRKVKCLINFKSLRARMALVPLKAPTWPTPLESSIMSNGMMVSKSTGNQVRM